MKIGFKITYDAGKLAGEMPKIIDKYLRTAIRASVKGAKERIDKGLSPPLEKSTIDIRKARGTGGTKPLYETGALYRSIKGTSEGINMNRYGIYHHKGFTPKKIPIKITKGEKEWFILNRKGIKVPARPFIMPSEKDITPAFEVFRKGVRKALKK